MIARLHPLTPLGVDSDGDPILHDAVLSMDRGIYVPRCDECGLPAGIPWADVCPAAKRADGRPRVTNPPNLYAGWLVFWSCRGLACCLSQKCEQSHLVRHRVALDREREKARRAA